MLLTNDKVCILHVDSVLQADMWSIAIIMTYCYKSYGRCKIDLDHCIHIGLLLVSELLNLMTVWYYFRHLFGLDIEKFFLTLHMEIMKC